MPRRDGTGPESMGSRTGRGLGDCQPGVNDNVGSRSVGRRFLGRAFGGAFGGTFGGGGYGAGTYGGGRGRNRFFPNPRRYYDPAGTTLQEGASQEEGIQEEITFLEQRLNQLKSFLKKD